MWIYEGHMGGLIAADHELSFEEYHCKECNRCDWCLGNFNSGKEFIESYANEIDYPEGYGGLDIAYFIDFVEATWPEEFKPEIDRDKILNVIIKNKHMEEEDYE